MPADTSIAAWQQLLGLAVILLAIWAVMREFEVRLILFSASLALGCIAFQPDVIVREFFGNFINEKFVIPLCCGMGFAHVLRHTGCDQHLVHLLVHPLSKVRFLLVPGTVLVGFLVNMPIVSQSSTAVTIGAVIIPILRAARISPVTMGAALLLGCSIGGELFNPAAPEVLTTFQVSQKAAKDNPDLEIDGSEFTANRCVQRLWPLNLTCLAVGTLAFWIVSTFHDRRVKASAVEESPDPATLHTIPDFLSLQGMLFLLKATVPLLPLVFLYLCSYPLNVIEVNPAWLVSPEKPAEKVKEVQPDQNAQENPVAVRETPADKAKDVLPTRLIGFAMLLGVFAAGIVTPSKFKGIGMAFFEGAGFGFGHIVSLIVVAQCFAKGIELVGFARSIAALIETFPGLLIPLAGILALGFAFLCGSGMATAQGLFPFFAAPALILDVDPTHVGAVVSLAAAVGRTMSPVAAVTLMCARMTGTRPFDLVKLVALPLVIALAVVIVVAMIIAPAA